MGCGGGDGGREGVGESPRGVNGRLSFHFGGCRCR